VLKTKLILAWHTIRSQTPRISFVASAPAPTKLLVRRNHPLTRIRKPLSLQQVLQYPLALMPAGYGVSHVIETLEYAEHINFNLLLLHAGSSVESCRSARRYSACR
jgi:hypothetical protein